MPRRPQPPKYRPLADYLAVLPAETTAVTLTLAAIEAILGRPLPRQAWAATWRANTPRYGHALAWMRAGWYVTARSFRAAEPAITFARDADSRAQPAAPGRP